MHKGRLIALDTPDALKNMAKKGEFFDVIAKNISDSQVNALKGIDGVISLAAQMQEPPIAQTRLRLRLEISDALADVFDFFFKEKIKILSFKQEELTLEDAFIELTEAGISEWPCSWNLTKSTSS
jgi:ABC-type multidrug transport system ATPase subunit